MSSTPQTTTAKTKRGTRRHSLLRSLTTCIPYHIGPSRRRQNHTTPPPPPPNTPLPSNTSTTTSSRPNTPIVTTTPSNNLTQHHQQPGLSLILHRVTAPSAQSPPEITQRHELRDDPASNITSHLLQDQIRTRSTLTHRPRTSSPAPRSSTSTPVSVLCEGPSSSSCSTISYIDEGYASSLSSSSAPTPVPVTPQTIPHLIAPHVLSFLEKAESERQTLLRTISTSTTSQRSRRFSSPSTVEAPTDDVVADAKQDFPTTLMTNYAALLSFATTASEEARRQALESGVVPVGWSARNSLDVTRVWVEEGVLKRTRRRRWWRRVGTSGGR